ncbi:MAG: hypothetical protein FWF66_07855 [Candidatus Bathyarchaeota archaeon]|nr:hypothetical protein [Candidatus Termiticorpusculum sp.]
MSGSANYTDGTKLDFRVQAVIGYRYSATAGSMASLLIGPADSMSFSTSSDWSAIQILTIPDGTASSLPSPTIISQPATSNSDNQQSSSGQTYVPGQTYAPSQMYTSDKTYTPDSIFANPLFMLVVGVLFGGVIVAVILVVVLRRQIKMPTYTNDSSCQALGVMLGA